MNWFKKPSSAPLRKVVLSIISINVIVMIMIEQYLASFVFASIVFGDIYTNYRNKRKKVDKKITLTQKTQKRLKNKPLKYSCLLGCFSFFKGNWTVYL